MADFESLKAELQRARDEIKLKLHLASMEVKEEFDGLEQKWQAFSERAEMNKSADGLGTALSSLGEELKRAYQRIRKAL